LKPSQFVVDDDKNSLRGDKKAESEGSSMEEITKVNSESGSDEPGMTKWSPKKSSERPKRPLLTLDIEAIN
jgi:hypothetical protein